MKNAQRMLAAAAAIALALAACSKKLPDDEKTPPPPATDVGGAPAGQAAPAVAPGGAMTGTVVETMDAASYTYVRVDLGDREIWAAAPKFEVKVGEVVSVPEGMPMEDYHSETLDRDFELVYFVAAITPPGEAPEGLPPAPAAGAGSMEVMPEGMHPKVDPAQAAKDAQVSFAGIAKADKTVEEIFAAPASFGGAAVAVRGKVVKYNAQIMGKNWIHLQDGSGAAGSNDLTVTTAASAQVGDTVLARGRITVDKDFGMGYRYSVIMEDAAVTVE